MSDPLSTIAIAAALGGVAGKFTEKAWDRGEKWLSSYFKNHGEAVSARAKNNMTSFILELGRKLKYMEESNIVSKDIIDKNQDHPHFSATLKNALIAAAHTDVKDKHKILSEIIAERLTQPPESTYSLASKLACDAVLNATQTQIHLLGLLVALHEIRPMVPIPKKRLYHHWLDSLFENFMDIDFKEIDALHLQAISCVIYNSASGRGLAALLMSKNISAKTKNKYYNANEYLKSDIGTALKFMWDFGLAGVTLTSIGSIIGGIHYCMISNVESISPFWAKDYSA